MLKLRLKTLDGLDEAQKKLYRKEGEEYVLDVEGLEDTGALKRAKEHEAQKHRETRDALKKAEEELASLRADEEAREEKRLKKAGDFAALEASYKEKLTAQQKEAQVRYDELSSRAKNVFVDSEAKRLAAELSISPELLIPHIRTRLSGEFDDNGFRLQVLDQKGKPTAATLEDFQKEVLANPAFKPILIASKATGGGAKGGGGESGASLSQYRDKDGSILWSKVAADAKTNPDLVNQVKTQFGAAAEQQ